MTETMRTILCIHQEDPVIRNLREAFAENFPDEFRLIDYTFEDRQVSYEEFDLILVSGDLIETFQQQLTDGEDLESRTIIVWPNDINAGAIPTFEASANLYPPFNFRNLTQLIRALCATLARPMVNREQQKAQQSPSRVMGVWTTDTGSRATTFSSSARNLLALNEGPDDVALVDLYARLYPADRPRFEQAIAETLRSGAPLDFKHQMETAKGTRLLWHYGELIRPSETKPSSLLVTVTDLSGERFFDQEADRLLELESLSYLIRGTAHEFNNYLTVILGNGEDLHFRMGESSEISAQLELIIDAAQSGAKLVRVLQNFSRTQISESQLTDTVFLFQRLEQVLALIVSKDVKTQIITDRLSWHSSVEPLKLVNSLIFLIVKIKAITPPFSTITIQASDVPAHQCKSNYPSLEPLDAIAISVTSQSPEGAQGIKNGFLSGALAEGTAQDSLLLLCIQRFLTRAGGHLLIDAQNQSSLTVTLLIPKGGE